MDEPLISIIIPAFRAEKRLGACLETVCAQSWKNLEIIVVNDGSTDGTGALADSWAEKDPRVRVLHQKNGGVASARNRGLEAASGEWVRFVDADDQLPPDSVELLYRRVIREKSDMVIAGYEHQVGGVCRTYNLAHRDDTVSCDEYLKFLNRYANSFFCGVLWNKLFRRDLIERDPVRFEGGLGFGEDFLFVCGYLKHAERVSFSTDTVYRYIRHPHSMTFSQTRDSFRHPIRNLKAKWRLCQGLKDLFRSRGAYEKYRNTLWLYMFRFTLNQ